MKIVATMIMEIVKMLKNIQILRYSKTCVKQPLKNRQTKWPLKNRLNKVLITNGSLMKDWS